MSSRKTRSTPRNRLLAALAANDFARLEPHLTRTPLPRNKTVERANKTIESVYFPTSGMASLVAGAKTPNKEVEVGIIGCEGMTGLPIIYGNHRSPHQTFIQIAGEGDCISASNLRAAMEERRTLQQSFLKYAQAFAIQTTHTAIANARGTVEQRLARWILMAQDRSARKEIPLTHEFLALMLAVRRPGVTEALHELTRMALVKHERGVILVKDRDGLIESAGGLYGIPESEYQRLVGQQLAVG